MTNPGVKMHGELKGLDLEDIVNLPPKAPLGAFGYSVPLGRPVVNTSINVNSPVFKQLAYLDDVAEPVPGPPGAKGDTGLDGSSFLDGTVNPISSQGKNGDKYLNSVSFDVFVKTNGAWSFICNIKGIPGIQGVPGKDGGTGVNSTVDYQWGQTGPISGTTIITSKNSAPTNTEGTEIWRKTIAAKSTGNRLTIEFTGFCDCIRRNTLMYFVLFKDNQPVDVVGWTSGNNSAGSPNPIVFRHISNVSDTNPHTYTMRMGVATATTWYLGRGMKETMGDITESYWSIREEEA